MRPETVDAVASVAAACCRHGIALTLRGAGTGNYGQSVPLEGGVVMLMGRLRAVRTIEATTGVVTVECGCLLKDLDQVLRGHGRQLRLLPSTWRSATIGGFIAGGSGGIGSVRAFCAIQAIFSVLRWSRWSRSQSGSSWRPRRGGAESCLRDQRDHHRIDARLSANS